MNLDGGVLTISRLINTASSGLMPSGTWTEVQKACYGERTVGVNRFYTAKQADSQIVMLVRIPRSYLVKIGDKVDLTPYSHVSDGAYIVDQVQQVDDEDTHLPATDLSLRVMREAGVR